MCETWRNSFKNFLSDMGRRPHGLTLDRINNNGNYEPGNCRWATYQQQLNNRRNSRLIQFHGETLPLNQVADRLLVPRRFVYERLLVGKNIHEIECDAHFRNSAASQTKEKE